MDLALGVSSAGCSAQNEEQPKILHWACSQIMLQHSPSSIIPKHVTQD